MQEEKQPALINKRSDDIALARTEIRQLDSQGEIYATVDESGAIIGTRTREVCQFLMLLADQELKTPTRINLSTGQALNANVHSAIEI